MSLCKLVLEGEVYMNKMSACTSTPHKSVEHWSMVVQIFQEQYEHAMSVNSTVACPDSLAHRHLPHAMQLSFRVFRRASLHTVELFQFCEATNSGTDQTCSAMHYCSSWRLQNFSKTLGGGQTL